MAKLAHLIEILSILQNKESVTTSELSTILEVDKKTVYRYIDAIEQANIPVVTKQGRFGGFYLDEDFYLKQPSLDDEELQALLMVQFLADNLLDFPNKSKLNSAVSKIINISKYDDHNDLILSKNAYFKGRFSVNLSGMYKNIKSLNKAILNNYKVNIKFSNEDNNYFDKTFIEPYGLYYLRGKWYVIGSTYNKTGEDKNIRAILVDKIIDLIVLDDIFNKPNNFKFKDFLEENLNYFFSDCFQIKIRFNKNLDEYIKKVKWHKFQKTYDEEDGSIILELPAKNLKEIKNWVLGFGKDAEVIEPIELRDEICEDIIYMSKLYCK